MKRFFLWIYNNLQVFNILYLFGVFFIAIRTEDILLTFFWTVAVPAVYILGALQVANPPKPHSKILKYLKR